MMFLRLSVCWQNYMKSFKAMFLKRYSIMDCCYRENPSLTNLWVLVLVKLVDWQSSPQHHNVQSLHCVFAFMFLSVSKIMLNVFKQFSCTLLQQWA